jgi:hypothetical protein
MDLGDSVELRDASLQLEYPVEVGVFMGGERGPVSLCQCLHVPFGSANCSESFAGLETAISMGVIKVIRKRSSKVSGTLHDRGSKVLIRG